ncbi:apolipoprotein N-acyltransferase [Chitiniphilus purpureus]|uniref:Apolipoprotein N-acyltransferase n=1 Tax=Chitiniphilus purpureus TaxID=2981137 RepID=A0ABY6DQ22_9NEIS|nr:apolipoprotein N-acyltransferase [Chitiniphilus sp. CD1]UXY16127.1 apolipoprotein N-acyltransferase [Chitiniphilus sp. CD1]
MAQTRLSSLLPRTALLHLGLATGGASGALAFAPLYWAPVMWLSLAALFICVARAPSAGAAAWRGLSWGMGYFVANIYWVFISMHVYGGMPAWMAAGCTVLFALYLALFPALAGWLGQRLAAPARWRLPLLIPAAFVATEYLRGWLFTGFPWASSGVSQLPHTPLAGFAPVLGAWGVGLLLALSVGLLASRPRSPRHWGAVAAIWLAGGALQQVDWTVAQGRPVTVTLVQGNIPQNMKWDEAHFVENLRTYLQLTRAARGELVILPETAIPAFLEDIPGWYLAHLRQAVGDRHLISGVPIQGKQPDEYYNAVLALSDATQPAYYKHHLVPFGEFVPVPALFGWMYRFLNMPLSGFTSGPARQAPLQLGATRLAPNVCYEDVFGREILRALPQATLLVNVSNLAWFDGSWAAAQHAQMSQARALETGRYMLRATNTGMTAIIDEKGHIRAAAPQMQKALLEGRARNFSGMTPYARLDDWPVLLTIGFILGAAALARRRI